MMTAEQTSLHAVQAVCQIDEELFVLGLDREGLAFVPGDCVALYSDAGTSRPYSIASGNQEESLQFIIRELPGGAVSPWLRSRKPGDRVRVSVPFGWFRPGQDLDGAPFVFIATGTGIAPFLSYSKSGSPSSPKQVLWGVRKAGHAVDFDFLKGQWPIQLAVSREQAAGHFHGRVTQLLPELEIDPEAHYYLCGLERMIDEVSEQLQARGIDIFHIHREVFFHD